MNREMQDIQLACFSLGDNLFAVDIMRIKEIIQPQKLSPLPKASTVLEGVINLRGNVIPVMDLRKRFGMPPAENHVNSKLLIVTLARQTLAMVVDAVMEVITVPVNEIKPPLHDSFGIWMEYLLGVCLCNESVYMLLDIDSLFGLYDVRNQKTDVNG